MRISDPMETEELERRVAEKIAEVQADIERLKNPKFQKLENLKKLEKMLTKEVELLRTVSGFLF